VKKLSWRAKLVALITLALGASLLFQLLYVIPCIRAREVDMAAAHQEEVARNIARELDTDLKQTQGRLLEFAQRPEFRRMDLAAMQRTTTTVATGSYRFDSLSVMDAKGWFVCTSFEESAAHKTRSYADRSFFSVPFEQGRVHFGAPRFYAKQRLLSVSTSAPIVSEKGQRVGVIIAGMRLNHLIERVANYPLEEGQVACVVDKTGTVVAYSGRDLFALKDGPLSLNYSRWPMVQAIKKGETGASRTYEHGGASYLGSYAILESNGWGVVVGASMRVIAAEADKLARWLLWVNLALFAAALSLSLVFARRITVEQKRAEEALQEERDFAQSLVETAQAIILVLDTEGRIVSFNPYMEQLSGYRLEEVKGKDWFSTFLPERDHAWIREVFRATLADIETRGNVNPILTRDGLEREIEWYDKTLKDADGRVTGVLAIGQDITDRKRAEAERRKLEAQMQHAQKLESLGVLAGGIAHDFNNLLVGVIGNAELALTELPPESPARYGLREIEKAGQRAADLCRQMLAYSGKGRFVVEPINLSRLVEETTHLIEVSVSKKAVVKYDLTQGLPAVEADATQLRQVVMNLITNASEAIGDKSGVITIRTGMMEADRACLATAYMDEELPEGAYVYLEVADTGCGMDEETLSRIFDPFFSTKFTGRGLGLAATLGIIRGHHGAVKIYSEPGKGTTFKVLLPCLDEPAADARKQKAADEEWHSSATVLVVDDEETARTIAKRMLGPAGLTVLTAADGCEAIEVFREHAGEIDAVLLDLTMPHMGGEETFTELRRIRPGVRVVLSSGYTEEDAVGRFAGKGLVSFIQKPYSRAGLVAALRTALEGSEGE